tara:strand:+ start:129 stop:545 length:417 start_codon:yes stop_codon:yes gene_type:complete
MKHLTALLLALLLLNSCSSELDRCIEANTGNLGNNLEEKSRKFNEEYRDEDGRPIEGWLDAYDDYQNNVLTDFERKISECANDKIDTYMEENNFDFSIQSKVDEYIDKSEEIWVSCEKSMPSVMVERATKICNSQGIY